jgi:predicted acetyltransferase
MDFEIRTVTPDEFGKYVRTLETAFSGRVTEDELELYRKVAEFDRMIVAVEGERIVGGAQAASFAMTVPGGALVPTAAVTAVGVLPTHRRRGINTEMMRSQLEDVRLRGEPLAALFASEGGIYGRFGYGMAAYSATLELETGRSLYRGSHRPIGEVRLLERDAALPVMRGVYEAAIPDRPGMMSTSVDWFENRMTPAEEDKDQPWFFAVHDSDEGDPDAYAVYQVKHEWSDGVPKLELSVRELQALTPGAYADMWRFVCDVDLVHTVTARLRPPDEPLLLLLSEPRRLRMRLGDGLYVRVVDVAAALAARSYSDDAEVVIEVDDAFCPWNDARYSVEATGGVATCATTKAKPDLSCSVEALGALYLGGTTWRQLDRAGRVSERTAGSLARADRMFASDPAPWCSFFF